MHLGLINFLLVFWVSPARLRVYQLCFGLDQAILHVGQPALGLDQFLAVLLQDLPLSVELLGGFFGLEGQLLIQLFFQSQAPVRFFKLGRQLVDFGRLSLPFILKRLVNLLDLRIEALLEGVELVRALAELGPQVTEL